MKIKCRVEGEGGNRKRNIMVFFFVTFGIQNFTKKIVLKKLKKKIITRS